jgi:hypothetical protein
VDFVTQALPLQAFAISIARVGTHGIHAVICSIKASITDTMTIYAIAATATRLAILCSTLFLLANFHSFFKHFLLFRFDSFFLGQFSLRFFFEAFVLSFVCHGCRCLIQCRQILFQFF